MGVGWGCGEEWEPPDLGQPLAPAWAFHLVVKSLLPSPGLPSLPFLGLLLSIFFSGRGGGGAPQFRAQLSWSSGLGTPSVLLSSFLQEEEMPVLHEHTWALSLLGAVCGSCSLKCEAWERLVPHPASHSCKSVGGLLETSSTLSFIFPFLFFLNTYIP